MTQKSKAIFQFFSVNLVMVLISGVAWKLKLIVGLDSLPESEYLMIGFLTLQFLIGLILAVGKQWETVYFVANTLPMWALICLGLNIYNSLASAHEVSAEVAFSVVKSAGLAILINSFGVFFMVWLKKLTYFMGGGHV